MGWHRDKDKAGKFDKLLDHIKESAKKDCRSDEDDFCVVEFSSVCKVSFENY